MSVTIKFRRGIESSLPTLAGGEPGFCTDTYKMFIGDGATNHEVITASSTTLDSRYFTETELGDSAANASAGAKKIGAYAGDFSNSSSSNVEDVLADLDSAISAASASGEVNTASNIGTGGVGVFDQKSGLDLQFKNIKSEDSHVTITDDGSNHEIDIQTDATSSGVANKIVARDGSGNFSAGTITADLSGNVTGNVTGNLTGNADTATALETARNFSISGDATASAVSFNGSANVNLSVTVDKVDGKDVSDAETSTSYLWTAGKIIDYVEANINGVSWMNPVIDKDLITPPGSPSTGDRYIVGANVTGISSTTSSTKTIVTASDISSSLAVDDTIKIKGAVTSGVNGQYTVASVSGTSVVVNEAIADSTSEGDLYEADAGWAPMGPDEIAEWNGSAWTNITDGSGAPDEGWAVWVQDEDINYTYNGTNWVTFGSTQSHEGLSGLQGGTAGEHYHLTSAQESGLTSGGDTSLHKHDNMYYTETELQGDGSAAVHWNNLTNMPSDFTPNQEATEDIVGAMVSGSTQDGISVTYADNGSGAGKLNFNVNDPTITLSGDVTGSATMTNLGNVDITTTVVNSSHSHVASDITDFDEAAQDAIDAAFTAGTQTGISYSYTDASNSISLTVDTATTAVKGIASFDSNYFDVAAGAVSLKDDGIDSALIDWGTGAGQVSTTVVPEGTNLYFTDARAQGAISVSDTHSVNLSYSSGDISAAVLVDDSSIKIDTVNDYIYVDSVDGGSF